MRVAADDTTATYGPFIVFNNVALSLRNEYKLKADVNPDNALKVSHELNN